MSDASRPPGGAELSPDPHSVDRYDRDTSTDQPGGEHPIRENDELDGEVGR
jgi:hypothetical protein